jgi:hypothetical protein
VFVDAAGGEGGDGSVAAPHKSITAAVKAVPQTGAVICVAQGLYPEQIAAGEKAFTLAGGFASGQGFKVRDSAAHVSKAQGNGEGYFVRIAGDTGPPADALTVVDGFEITGYSQAIVRDHWEPQRFDITNNHIHDNTCKSQDLAGGAFALINTSGTIKGNVIRKNACGRGGGGALVDNLSKNTILVASNLVDANAGTEPDASHGGAFYFFVNKLTVEGNLFTNNTVTQWGAGLFVGAYPAGGQITNATMRWNIYRANKAGDSGGGFFCDEGANCLSENELYVGNCGGNVLVDGGGTGPTTARFNHITSVGGLTPDCSGPGIGFSVDTYETSAPDSYAISNAIFWGNAEGQDIVAICEKRCEQIKVTVEHSLLKASPGQGININYGPNIVAPADPQFVAPENGDYRLQPGSPAEGKGAPAGADLGAYPKGSNPPAAAGVAANAAAPAAVTPAAQTPVPTPPPAPAATAEPAAAAPAKSPEASLPAPVSAPAATVAAGDDAAVKSAFDDAKALGTIAAWRAFLATYPEGFHADLAKAYLRNLGYTPGSGEPQPAVPAAPAAPAAPPAATVPPPQQAAPAPQPTPQPPSAPAAAAPQAGQAPPPAQAATPPPTPAAAAAVSAPRRVAPAVKRGAKYFGFPEQFNRYYTDPNWKPAKTIFVSPTGSGDGTTRDKPASLSNAVNAARPGTLIHLLSGAYKGGIEFTKDMSGTYADPIVLFGERNAGGTLGVTLDCETGERKSCFNFEGANYIAVDGFVMARGNYGVRAVGLGFPASEHSRGIAMLNSEGRDQQRDPFKTAQADWTIIEGNLGYGAQKGDGHGIYVSGGSDWSIIRNNQTHSNESSDLQINADPASNCKEVGIPFDDPRCDAYAGQGEGGQGASDYFLVEGNYCHRSSVGPNFTSVRRSMIRNNIFGPQIRHNVSFWQETDNPKLASSENRILNNLFITTRRHGIKFENHSGRNIFAHNILLGVNIDGEKVTANPSALLMETDATSSANTYQSNIYVSGTIEGRKPGPGEITMSDFSHAWFKAFPVTATGASSGFAPAAGSPFLDKGKGSPDVPADMNGTPRRNPSDLGPLEVP